MARTFYRIIRSPGPTLDDFRSNQVRGIPPPDDDPQRAALHDGISVYNTETQARNKALDFDLGGFLAVLEIPDDAPIDCQRKLSSRGHHTLRGDPAYLLSCVVSVLEV